MGLSYQTSVVKLRQELHKIRHLKISTHEEVEDRKTLRREVKKTLTSPRL